MGDERRTQRLIKLVDDLSARPTASIPLASGGWADTKAASRLLDNPALDGRELLEVHTPRTEERLQGHPLGLCLPDTTEGDFTSQPGIAGLGRLSDEAQHGRYVHPTLAVTPDGLALGGVDAWSWARGPKEPPQVKESWRWIEGYQRVAEWAAPVPDTRLVEVADREGEIRALMAIAAQGGHPADWLVRAKHHRNPALGEQGGDRVAQAERLGAVECLLPAAPGRAARRVRQTLDTERGTVPARRGAPALAVTAIRARAAYPPAGEQALEWRLLTQRTAETLEQVVELIEGSRRRWRIEIFFRILKAGCRVAAVQRGTLDRLERARVSDLLIAWRLLHVVTWGRDGPELPCDGVFAPAEWQAAWIVAHRCPPPATPPNLGVMGRLSAGFGGFLGRKGDGHPGPKALWEGMQRVEAFAMGIAAAKEAFSPSA